jgi:hypothetical protein
LKQEQFKGKRENQALIAGFGLASRLNVQLATHEQTKRPELELGAEKGIVKIRGKIITRRFSPRGKQKTMNDLIEIAQQVHWVERPLIGPEKFSTPLSSQIDGWE